MPTPAHVQLAIARRRAGLLEIKGLESKSTEWVNSEMGQKEGQRAYQDKARALACGMGGILRSSSEASGDVQV
jgi:hypothetical protein